MKKTNFEQKTRNEERQNIPKNQENVVNMEIEQFSRKRKLDKDPTNENKNSAVLPPEKISKIISIGNERLSRKFRSGSRNLQRWGKKESLLDMSFQANLNEQSPLSNRKHNLDEEDFENEYMSVQKKMKN